MLTSSFIDKNKELFKTKEIQKQEKFIPNEKKILMQNDKV